MLEGTGATSKTHLGHSRVMAPGTGWKAVGIVFLILGGLLLVAGVVAVGAAMAGEQDNRDGVLQSGQRSEANSVVLVGGVAAGGAGLLLLVLGGGLVAVGAAKGGAASPRFVRKPLAARIAGRTAQATGWVAVIVGALALVAALAAVGFVYVDEQDNRGNGPLADPGRADRNDDVLTAAAAGGIVGAFLLVVGILVVWVGGRAARAPRTVHLSGARARATGAVGTVLALLAILGVLALLSVVPGTVTSDPSTAGAFEPQELDGTVLALPRGSSASLALDPPAEASEVAVEVTWASPPSGPTEMAVALVTDEGDVLVEATGASPLVLGADLVAGGLTLQAAVASGTFVSQDFHASVSYA